MAKKKVSRQKKREASRRRNKLAGLAAIGLLVVLSFGMIAGRWRNTSGGKRLRALFTAPVPPPTIPPVNNPSKEYIYAGGKLIATEAPVPLLPPANLIATTLSNLSTAQVSINWEATTGADHYQVERTNNITTEYSVINSNIAGTTFTDNSVTSGTAYLYRVRAADSAGNLSPPSNFDLATAISFTDDSIVISSTTIKAAHINELRQAVNAVRATTANLGPANWGGSINAGVSTVQATHIQDLRTNLDQARSALGLSACAYTDNSIAALQASFIKKEHFDQLRQCVK